MGEDSGASFREKWVNNPTLALDATLDESSEIFRWILERNGFARPADLRMFLQGKRRVLDAGCGNGRVTALLRRYSDAKSTAIVGVDLVAADVARRNLARLENVVVEEADLLGNLQPLGKFDFIYCQEVLHHTRDPRAAFHNLCDLLVPGGEIAIYVYRVKAPVREFSDDYLRREIGKLGYAEAMEVCRQIAELGRALADAKTIVRVPAVPALKIEAGEYDVQRFVYHFFLKCFWNPQLGPEGSAVVNFDWYHPSVASRHTREEVEAWMREEALEVVHVHVDPYGITARGRRAG